MGERVLTDVPQGYCPLCGSRVYKGDVLAMIEALYRSHARSSPRPAVAESGQPT
jgi:hypothetical protein